MSAFLKLDVFRKLPRDLTEPTTCGAMVSTVCAIALIFLTVTEIRTYLQPSTSSMIGVQSSHAKDVFKINLDIEMPKMPCDIIGLDLMDQMGNHVADYYGELHKHRLDKNGEELSVESWQEKNANRRDILERAEKEFEEGQGCRISGYVEAQRVPGNFHLSHHAFGDIVSHMARKGVSLNNSFKIHHLSFGEKADFSAINRHFPDVGLEHPLDGFEHALPGDKKHMRCGFYLKAVPALFLSEFANFLSNIIMKEFVATWEVFQLTATSEIEYASFENIIVFNYEVSPFAVQYTNAKENFFQFLINMLAIVGGIFTMAGIVDSLIHKGSKIVFKDRINKLQ